MKRTLFEASVALLSGLLCVAPAAAGVLVVAGQEGTGDPPEPTEGASTEEDWNPVVTCTLPPGGTVDDLLQCLLDLVATPPPCLDLETQTPTTDEQRLQRSISSGDCSDPQSRQDFVVTLLSPPEYGVEIRRLDGTEIDRLALRENDPGIQTTELRNERPDRVARIRLLEQTPRGGTVFLTINDVTVTLRTSPAVSILEQNGRLLHDLGETGLIMTYVSPYLYVRDRRHEVWGVNRLQFRSTDPGIIQSDLGLYPEGDPIVPPPGPVAWP